MAKQSETLYIGIGGHVVALDRTTGSELWRCKVKGSNFVSIFSDSGAVYAGASGELFCIDPATGQIRWQNPLKGLGRNFIVFGGTSTATMVMAAIAAEAAAAAAAAGAVAAAS